VCVFEIPRLLGFQNRTRKWTKDNMSFKNAKEQKIKRKQNRTECDFVATKLATKTSKNYNCHPNQNQNETMMMIGEMIERLYQDYIN